MSAADWSFIIEQGERQNYDFKGSMAWADDTAAGLLKDLAALANTRDGGAILIGIKDANHKIAGLNGPQLKSFDVTTIGQRIERHFSPAFEVRVEKPTVKGKHIACLVVSEFTTDPVICHKQVVAAGADVVRVGAVLVRTVKGQSQVCGPAEMRELLGRAMLKRRNELLEQIRQLVGAPVVQFIGGQPGWAKEELTSWAAFVEEMRATLPPDTGFWEFTAVPVDHPSTSYPHVRLVELLRHSEVALRGWNVPHAVDKDVQRQNERIEATVEWFDFRERWRLTTDIIFGDARTLWEDTNPIVQRQPGKRLEIPAALFSVTEYVLFVQRLAAQAGYGGPWVLTLRLHASKGRRLTSTINPEFDVVTYAATEDRIELRAQVGGPHLASGWESIAADLAVKLYGFFGLGLTEEDARSQVERFRDRRP